MIVCKYCNHHNRSGELFCEDCGRNLATYGTVVLTAVFQPDNTLPDLDQPDTTAPHFTGTGIIGSSIIFQFENSSQSISITPDPTKRLVLGRADESVSQQPDIDLGPFGALEKGVSRHHAALEMTDDTLILMDIGSSNGTFLNGLRLGPKQAHVLRDGDEIRLGKLAGRVFFGPR